MIQKSLSFVERFPDFKGINDRVRLLVLQGTPFCNLGCSYCYLSEQQRATKSLMPLETVHQAARFLKDSGLLKDELTILWHAGEPLTAPMSYYKEAIKILRSALSGEVDLKFDFQTNAVSVTEEWCRFINDHDLRIGVSIDGPEHIHNAYRLSKNGKGTFSAVMRGIEKLKKNNIPFSTISVVTDKTLEAPVEVITFLDQLDSISIGFNIEEVEGANKKSSVERSNPKVIEFIRNIYDWLDERGKLKKCREIKSVLRTAASAPRTSFRNRQGENKAFSIITVAQNGELSTFSPELSGLSLEGYGKFAFGTVSDSIESVVENPVFKHVFSDIEEGINECERKCRYFQYCSGGSPSNKLMENGTFASTETQQCWFRRQVFSDVVLQRLLPTELQDAIS